MANVRTLRKEASSLLRVAKAALRFIRDNPTGLDEEREQVLTELRSVIDRADPPSFDEDAATLTLVMTIPTADAIVEILTKRVQEGHDEQDVLSAVKDGMRRTQQRCYLRLDLNHAVLKKLHFLLRHTNKTPQEKSFKRLAEEIEKGCERNPMEILGRMGL